MDLNKHTRFGVILAGGSGERFWPLSRRNKPKQLLQLTHPYRTMLEESLHRIEDILLKENIYIVTNKMLQVPIQKANIGLPYENIIVEPSKRNTTGALAYITATILARHPHLKPNEISIAVLTSDHHIGDIACFKHTINTAMAAAEKHHSLVTCGIKPTAPETGYGYIQVDKSKNYNPNGISVHPVLSFHEKPDHQNAKVLISKGNSYWNSGMFFWTLDTFQNELSHSQPEIAQTILDIRDNLQEDNLEGVKQIFESIKDISIDYALMERAQNILVVEGTFPWSDIGSLPALKKLISPDEKGNYVFGEPALSDVSDSLIYNELGGNGMAVGVLGVKDIIIITTQDAVLVASKNRAQDVPKIVAQLKDKGMKQL